VEAPNWMKAKEPRDVRLVMELIVQVWGLGFGVWGLGFGVWCFGFWVLGLGFWVWGLGFCVQPQCAGGAVAVVDDA